MMKPLVIVCSPRANGNCDCIGNYIDENFDVDIVTLRSLKYAECNGCNACSTLKRCVHTDDADILYDDIDKRNVIIMIAPVYFYNFDAHTKAFIDRSQFLWSNGRAKQTKKLYLIGVGGQTREDIFYPMERTSYSFALTIGAKYMGGLFFRGVDGAGDIKTQDNFSKIHNFMIDVLNCE